MNLSDWLDLNPGKAAEMARHFKVTEAAIHHWRARVPTKRMRAVREFTCGEVSLEDMVPGACRQASMKEAG